MEPKKFINEWVEDLEPYIPGETMEGFVKLASNENNYGPSPKVVKAIEEFAPRMNLYPYQDEQLRRKIADYLKVEPDNILAGNGSDELIDLVLKTFRGNVASFYPSFSEYKICSLTLGKEFTEIKLNEDFSFDAERFLKKTEVTDILFLCSPNNPSGAVIGEREIESILDKGKITVVDEAYVEFSDSSIVSWTQEYNNLIVLRTFAKAFGLAGLRIGYAVANPGITRYLRKVKPPFNVNLMAQIAALAALEDVEYMQDCVSRIVNERERVKKELSNRFQIYDSGANFLLVDVSPTTSDRFFESLLEKKIIVRNFGNFNGFEGEYVRISIGTEEENDKLLDAVSAIQI